MSVVVVANGTEGAFLVLQNSLRNANPSVDGRVVVTVYLTATPVTTFWYTTFLKVSLAVALKSRETAALPSTRLPTRLPNRLPTCLPTRLPTGSLYWTSQITKAKEQKVSLSRDVVFPGKRV